MYRSDLHTTAIHRQSPKLAPTEEQIWSATRPTSAKNKTIQFSFLSSDSVILLRDTENTL